tara:strand:- start:3839 stop:5173 length:1335 start_codon:yes stop_codon:yes gene_type:complete
VATKRISQLDTIADGLVTGEAVLPIVISDPLIPNRKAKVNQLFRGVSAGSQTAPGLAFDLDRDSGIYQSAVNELGLTFGSAAVYHARIANTDGSSTVNTRVIDSQAANSNYQITPQGSGYFTVNGVSQFTDQNTIIQGAQNPGKRFYFNADTVSAQTGTRRIDMPDVGTLTSTTLVADDTVQTISNKTIVIKDDQLQITGSSNVGKLAKFECDSWESPGTHTYKLPDFGASVVQSTLLDDITAQNVFNKNMVNPTFSGTPSNDPNTPTRKVIFSTSALTQDRTASFPDLNVVVVGEASTQTLTNKTYAGAVLQDTADETKKVAFNLTNINENSTLDFTFPEGSLAFPLNNGGNSNVIVAEQATQIVNNKILQNVSFDNPDELNGRISFDVSNITETVNIQFPNADATLLSTNNISDIAINFGGPISAPVLGGQLRLQSYFQSGW